VKYTTKNPNQLPTTPIAQYELVNINGRNSNFCPQMIRCNKLQYNISGMLTAMYSKLNLSNRKIRGLLLAGASLSKASRKSTSQNTVYTVLIGNSADVNNSGKSETCPATANGRNAPRYRRSLSAIKLKGMMTSRIAFS
jgi:hypothetical protein